MFLLICSIVLIICAVKYIFRDKELYNFADSLPGPKSFAVIGSSHKFVKKNEQGKKNTSNQLNNLRINNW